MLDALLTLTHVRSQIDELKASPATAASGVEGASQPTTSGYPPQPAYQPTETPNVVAPPAENSNSVPAPAGTGYPPQPAYQPSPATSGYPPQPAYQPSPSPAVNDNSARIAQLTAEMQECASSDQFARAMELNKQVGNRVYK